MSIVIQPNDEQFKNIQNNYQTNVTLPVGSVFRHKKNNVMITGYKSKKVMFQGKDEAIEARKWTSQVSTTKKTSLKDGLTLPNNFAQLNVIGSDEVGTGSYFGPLTVVATYVDQTNFNNLKKLNITDSKAFTNTKIIELAEKLIYLIPYKILNIMPKEYNEYQKKLNANEIKARAHNKVLHQLLSELNPIKPDAILVDQFVQESTYWKYLKNVDPKVTSNLFFKTKAENIHLSVAAASIIARYVELKTMQELSNQVNLTLPIGAGKAVDIVAAKLINQNIDLSYFAKLHFANTKKAKIIANK